MNPQGKPVPAAAPDLDGILLVAHGARDPRWALPFEQLRDAMILQCPARPVELAFLEFMAPNIQEGAARLIQQECRSIVVAPLFLGAGGHVMRDIPQRLEEVKSQFPAVKWRLLDGIGQQAEVLKAMHSAIDRMIFPTP